MREASTRSSGVGWPHLEVERDKRLAVTNQALLVQGRRWRRTEGAALVEMIHQTNRLHSMLRAVDDEVPCSMQHAPLDDDHHESWKSWVSRTTSASPWRTTGAAWATGPRTGGGAGRGGAGTPAGGGSSGR